MSSCLECWIFSCFLLTYIQNLPIQFGQDSESVKKLGDVAATSYGEWERCLGFKCELWESTQKQLGHIECLTGQEEACQSPTDTLEGDILLSPEQIVVLAREVTRSHKRRRRKIQAFNKMSQKWDLPIKFMFDHTYKNNDTAKRYVQQAISHWESHTCITFQELQDTDTVEGPYVIFTSGGYCGSFIGQMPVFPQPIRLSASCLHLSSIAHEIGHLIGFWHEHQRLDRDDYVTINGDHAQTKSLQIFSLELKGETSNFVPYDYGSLMHYWAWAFTKTGKQTISPKDTMYSQVLGQKVGLSFLDAKLANIVYCPRACHTPLQGPCQHGGYQDPHNCHKCRCPDGFGGVYCDQVAPSVHGDCSELIRLSEGESREITSPGYHDNVPYSDNVQCNWLIQASDPHHRLLLHLDGSYFGVYCNKKLPVCFHWLEVKYHRDQSLTGPRICCAGRPVMSLRSEGQQMTLTMRANFPSPAAERSGFKLTVTSERDCGQVAGKVPAGEVDCGKQTEPTVKTELAQVPGKPLYYPLCTRVDLAIAFDETWSSSVRFHNVIHFLTEFVQNFQVDPDHVQIGFVHFGTTAYIKHALNKLRSQEAVLTAVSSLSANTGTTNIAAAFKLLRTEFFTSAEGSRPGVTNACLLFVNSNAKKELKATVDEALQLRQVARIYAVGTLWANITELEAMTGSPEQAFFKNAVNGLIEQQVAELVYRHMCGFHNSSGLCGTVCIVDTLVSDTDVRASSNHAESPTTNSAPPHPNAAVNVGGTETSTKDPGQWSCEFEPGTTGDDGAVDRLCGMLQEHTAGAPTMWNVQDSSLSQSSSIQPHTGRGFIYLGATPTWMSVSLFLPQQTLSGKLCLSFYTLLIGEKSNHLEVIKRDSRRTYTRSLWQLTGDLGPKWYLVDVDVELEATEQVGFMGTVYGHNGGIGLDSVTLTTDTCYRNRLLRHFNQQIRH